MATARLNPAFSNIVKDRTLKLATKDRISRYSGIAVINEKLLVTDYMSFNLQVFNRQDGTMITTSDRQESVTMAVCILNNTEVAVCLYNGKIKILSLTSKGSVKQVSTLDITKGFDFCDSVAKWMSDRLLVSGRKDGVLRWAICSIKDGGLDSTHDICEGKWTHLTVKHNTVYVLCCTFDSFTKGVYAFDIINPYKAKFLYQHQELTTPWSIIVDRDYLYVCDENSNNIHQVTDTGQLVTIHTVSSRVYGMFYDDNHGVIYATSFDSNIITLYKIENPHQAGTCLPIEILNMDDRSIKRFEEALKDGKETVYSIRIMVVGCLGAGKTTLVKRLLGEEVHISERKSTEGIDVYVNCSDVSLTNYEWIRQAKDSEQDYKLHRLVKVLNENYQGNGEVVDVEFKTNSKERDINDGNPMRLGDDEKHKEVLYRRSQQNILSASSVHIQPSSNVNQSSLSQSKRNTIAESGHVENNATENCKTSPLREMLSLLHQNPNKTFKDVSKYARLTILDFAGEYAFYTTHQMFLTRRAIYLLVLDTSKNVNDLVETECYFDSKGITKNNVQDLIDIWMNSIHSCASTDNDLNSGNSHSSADKVITPPTILVGTHIDQIPKKQKNILGRVVHHIRRFVSPGGSNPATKRSNTNDVQAQLENCRKQGHKYLKEIRSYLQDKPTMVHLVDEDFPIDNTIVDSKVEELKRKIVEVASQQPYWGEQIPTCWFLLEQQLMKLKDAGVKVISRITVEILNKEANVHIKDNEELDLFLRYLHETGTIFYFSIEILRDNVMLDPKWLIDALKTLINALPTLPNILGTSGMTQKWSDFKEKGLLTLELVDAIWTKEAHPELNKHKSHLLMIMEQLNIIAKVRSFDVMGVKEEDYFLTPCMLRQAVPTEVISPEQVLSVVSTPEMCCIFRGKYLPSPIFHRLIAGCVAHWSVAKEKSEHLIFCGCCVFDLDLFHRLTVFIKNHVISAKITRRVIDEVKRPNAKLCSQVRRFITMNLTRITSYLCPNLQYDLDASDSTWREDEGYNSDPSITPEHMNHQRLSVALMTVCGNAMREILCTCVPYQYTDIYQAILANKKKLTSRQGRCLLNSKQSRLVFPDPQGATIGKVDHFDLTLLYTLIRNISTVSTSFTGWGKEPKDQPRDRSLGASIERIRFYRNYIIGHSTDGKISRQVFDDYWNKIEAVLEDIEVILGTQGYMAQLKILRMQVISAFEAS